MAKQPPKKVPAPKGAELKLESVAKIKRDRIQQDFYNSVGGEYVSPLKRPKGKEMVDRLVADVKVANAMSVGRTPVKSVLGERRRRAKGIK